MISWEEMINAESVDELKEAKLWLFRENMRLQQERQQLAESKEQFSEESKKLRKELDELNSRITLERKRMKEENLFFEKKMEILKDGFRRLEADRQTLEHEKRLLAQEKKTSRQKQTYGAVDDDIVEILFRNATNPLALRKRYRDLVKIFHPDNLFGDPELMQSINREFIKKKEEL